MDSKREELLDKTYSDYLDLMLYDFPIDRIEELVADDVKGYGTTIDEKFPGINRLQKMVRDQREQGSGFKIHFLHTPVHRRISPNKDTAIYTDEFLLTMEAEGTKNEIPMRVTSVFEFDKNTWKLVHIHGSQAVETEEDTWHQNVWKRKNEELQRLVDQKTADLEKKNRELEIEAALERVRSRSLAMHKSSELEEVVNTVFERIRELNIEASTASILLLPDQGADLDVWVGLESDQMYSTQSIKVPETDHPEMAEFNKYFKSRKPYFTTSFTFEEKNRFWNHLFEHSDFKYIPKERKKFILETEAENAAVALLKNTGIQLIRFNNKPFTEQEGEILKRFTKVFEQAYTRFLDLQKAEAQACEAIKQASLDRVRGEIASMRTSEDLNRITPVIWRELQAFEVPFIRCGVFIINEKQEKVHVYLSTPSGKALAALHLTPDANELTKNTVEHWRGRHIFKTHWDKQEFVAWTKSMMNLGQVANAETYQGSVDAPESLNLHFVPFRQGMLYVGDVNPLTNDKVKLVKTLAEAFSIAYARYEDFKNLEEAKDKIETTLKELKEAQAQLIQSEKMASLGELTAGIAHEIQNPLNFVNNFSDLNKELIDELKEELAAGNTQLADEITNDIKENEGKINHHGKRAESIVKGMLLHSRGSSGQKELTDINALCDEYLRLSYHGFRAKDKSFNADFKLEADPDLPKVNVIPQDIGRVLLNLINNAFYACAERSRSTVNEKVKQNVNDYKPTVVVITKLLGNEVEIKVQDNGNGIPNSVKEKIFQPFFTTKPTGQGTGLGLSLSYDIVKAHGGDLAIDTKPGEGTTFIIKLPNTN